MKEVFGQAYCYYQCGQYTYQGGNKKKYCPIVTIFSVDMITGNKLFLKLNVLLSLFLDYSLTILTLEPIFSNDYLIVNM